MNQSENINELVSALAKAQGEMKAAEFNRTSHFKKYADFTSCMNACREPLSKNGLAVMQYAEINSHTDMKLVTMLAHTSGQWMKSYLPLLVKTLDSQSIGSAMTYMKRYGLSALLGIVSDEDKDLDDDGETSVGRGKSYPEPVRNPPAPIKLASPKINLAQIGILKSIEDKLDAECKAKIYDWLKNSYKIESLQDISVEIFPKVMSSFENALKYIESNKLELAHA